MKDMKVEGLDARPPYPRMQRDMAMTTKHNKGQIGQAASQPGCSDECLDQGYVDMGRISGSTKGDLL